MNFRSLLEVGIVVPVIGLSAISLSVIESTVPSLLLNQAIYFILGFILYLLISLLDYRILFRFKNIFWILAFLLLLSSFLGPNIRGSYRWLDFGFTRIQPSEIAKPFLIIFLASRLFLINNFKFTGLLKSLAEIFPMIFIIFRQPDLGNVLVILFTFVTMEVAAGLPFFILFSGILLLTILLPFFWGIMQPFQKTRILSFLNPYQDPAGAGYNAIQAVIAIGSGGFWGLGLGRGTQSHLLFLPEYHTDFVFASLGEELGFIGGFLVIIFYFILLTKILRTAFRSDDKFAKLLCVGIFAQLFIQVFINIGMNLGVLPITGITLPLLSFGGSSILSTFISLGIVASITKDIKRTTTIEIK